MRRMFSKKQINALISEAELSEEQIQQVSNMLVGHYVRIMDAPESTTLTDDQIAQVEEGVFINGEFLGVKNPILCPAYVDGSNKIGLILTMNTVRCYLINSSKVISLVAPDQRRLYLNSIYAINNKAIPAFPSNTGTFVLKSVDGTLTWVEEV